MKSLSLLIALLCCGATLSAEQIFILFDGNCGDRVRYEQAVAQQPRMDYFAYHFGLANDTKLILETGVEGSVVQNNLPEGYIYCGDPRLNLQLSDRVNTGSDRVFILLPAGNNQFLVQPVIMAAVLERRGADFTYQSSLTGFQFNSDNAIIGVNLAYNNPQAKVYFEGRDNNACSGLYLFRQLNPGNAYPVIDFKMVPELGITERRLGSDGISSTGGAIMARDVNGQPVEQYLAAICAAASAQMANSNMPTYQSPNPQVAQIGGAPATYGGGSVATPQPYAQPESAAYNQSAARPSNVTHTVSKGETLYAISRKYGTTVEAVKASNGLSSNTVYPGQQLTVATTVNNNTQGAMAQNQSPTTTVPTMPYSPGNVATSNPGASTPTPYGSTATPQAYNATLSARGQSAVYGEESHIVQPGETVASVALKYGYTSAKLREINDLGSNEVIKVGQRLTTSDCDCPPPTPTPAATTPAPQAYGATPSYQAPAAAPNPYGGTVAPQMPSNTGTGTPVGSTAPSYRAPSGYSNPNQATSPTVPAPTTINNRASFGEVVPNTSAAPTSTMNNLESRSPAPTTYGSYTPPATNQAAPTAYGGTPVGAGVDYSQPTQNNANRASHLVQEGESLFSIARRYGMTVEDLRGLNNLSPADVIVPFQKLYVN